MKSLVSTEVKIISIKPTLVLDLVVVHSTLILEISVLVTESCCDN